MLQIKLQLKVEIKILNYFSYCSTCNCLLNLVIESIFLVLMVEDKFTCLTDNFLIKFIIFK